MSIIQKLRSKTGITTIFIGVALLAFVITGLDPQMFSSITGNENVIAEIKGEKYPYEAYYEVLERLQQQLDGNASEMQQQGVYSRAWDAFIARNVYDDTYEKIGIGIFNPWLSIIGISSSEFEDIMIGDNIAPEVYNADIFKNPDTRQFDKDILLQTLANLSSIREQYPDFYMEWLNFETGMHQKVLETKLNTIVSKAMYPTALEIEMAVVEESKQNAIEFIKIDYNSIADSLVTVTDKEIATYYEAHKKDKKFMREDDAVTIEYVSFAINPTAEDIRNTEIHTANLRDGFINARNIQSFLNINSDIKFDPTYYKKGVLPEVIDDFAFSQAIDSTTDMYLENNMYKIAKISDIRYASDSARARHILLIGEDAMQKADSLQELLANKKANFTDLVRMYSADSASIPMGGVIDWFYEGQMVQPFQDTCFFGERGKFYITPTQYGVHIIEILNQGPKSKRVQVQYLAREIQYSTDTRKAVYSEAVNFASKNETKEQFDISIAENNTLVKRIAENVTPNQRFISGISDSRDLIRWAHDSKNAKGMVSDIFTCGDAFVVAVVTETFKKGTKTLAQVKDEIQSIIRIEKKQAYITNIINNNAGEKTLQAIGELFNVTPIVSNTITFASVTAQSIGKEPKVIGTATNLEVGAMSNIILGETGVYMLVVTDSKTVETDAEQKEMRMASSKSMKIINNLFPYLKEKANIVDNRLRFL